MHFTNFISYFIVGILSWLILLIISCVFLYKSLKRKNILQIILFGICFSFTLYMTVKRILLYNTFENSQNEIDKKLFLDLNNGDVVIMNGQLGFNCNDSYQKQDSLLNIDSNSDSSQYRNYIYLVIAYRENNVEFKHRKTINMLASEFISFKNYFDYKKQLKDSIAYELSLKVQSFHDENNNNLWRLINIIKIDSVKSIPLIEGIENCN